MSECQNLSLGNYSIKPPDNSTEANLQKIIHYIAMDIGVPSVCAFGMLGNILNLMVLTREKTHRALTKMEKSAHIGLIALAISDFMFCLLALLFTLMPFEEMYTEATITLYYEWLGPSFITIFIITSTWLTVIMAGERYIAVCHPFKARKLISLKRTRVTIMLIYGTCLCAAIPLFFEKIVKAEECAITNMTVYSVALHEVFSTIISIRRLVWAILFDFIPCAALLYFNTCLIYKIHRAKKLRRNMAPMQKGALVSKYRDMFTYETAVVRSGNASSLNYAGLRPLTATTRTRTREASHALQQNSSHYLHITHRDMNNSRTQARRKNTDSALNSVTATLVAVVVLFLILVSPSEILKFSYKTSGKRGQYTSDIIRDVTNFMQAVNFSVNFVLYCAVNKSFRSTLASIFCGCRHSISKKCHFPSFERAHVNCPTFELRTSSS
ncbi:hypothetical protein ACJMK2_009822 [Sinanodonta woodiana]|uniref:G-protein coupled receptors family 1 profile domain-containing protein n=1 Tax=Sinanodonta woodiana TaxID=1069815 RepID=A0ABD3VF25_SINWO